MPKEMDLSHLPVLVDDPSTGQGVIKGSEFPAPGEAFSVSDYPYLTPGSVDVAAAVYLAVVFTSVAVFALRRRRTGPGGGALMRLGGWLRRHRLVAVVAFFLGLEAVLQLTSILSAQRMYRPDPVVFWRLAPASRSSAQSQNSQGLDSPEIPLAKPSGVRRVLCLGDSNTMGGAGVGSSAAYPHALQKILRASAVGGDWDVINAGISGYTTYQGLFLLRKVGVKYHPDILVIAYGQHDGALDWAEDKHHMTDNRALILLRGLLYKSQVYLVLRKHLLNLKTVYHESGLQHPSFYRVNPDDYRANLRAFINLAKKHGMKTLFLSMPFNPHYDPKITVPSRIHLDILRHTAEEYAEDPDVGFIDLYESWGGLPPEVLGRLIVDQSHPTPHGHRIIARTVANYIDSRWLQGSAGREEGRP